MKGEAASVNIKESDPITELSGKLSFQALDDKLMHLVIENDEQSVEKGKTIQEALDSGLGALTPDLVYENLVRNYRWAQKLFGPRLLKALTGYDPNYLENNIRIPEFQRELKGTIARKLEALKREGLLQKDGTITESGVELSALMLFVEELEHIKTRHGGEHTDKKALDREPQQYARPYRGERYRDISPKKTIHTAVHRGHQKIAREDLRVLEQRKRGEHYIVYAIDSSGSMKGDKIKNAKKAGIALAYRATMDKSKVGLLVFGKKAKETIMPGASFVEIMKALAAIQAKEETDLAAAISEASTLFPDKNVPRHLIILTDSLPTIGEKPIEETLEQVSIAASRGITISLIGLNLTEEGRALSQRIVEIGKGRLYVISDYDSLDTIVLEEYDLSTNQ